MLTEMNCSIELVMILSSLQVTSN